MKKLLAILILFTAFLAHSQDYHYKFSMAGVVDLPTAKDIKDPLRAKFKCYTVFNDTIGFFDFVSTIKVTEEELQAYISPYGHTLTYFLCEQLVAEGEELIEEEE